MGEDKKDTIKEERKRKSDLINNKTKWPFVIFFVIGIFVAISIVARVYQDKFNDLYTPALYLFSTIAQTMGALLGIGLALLYTAVSNMRPNPNMPALEPAKRIILKDVVLRQIISFGLISISFAILGLLFILLAPNSSNIIYTIILLIGYISILFGVLSVMKIVIFTLKRYHLCFLPNLLLAEFCEHNVSKDVYKINDYAEICLLLGALGINNKYTTMYFMLIKSEKSFQINQTEITINIINDIYTTGAQSQNKALLYSTISYLIKLYADYFDNKRDLHIDIDQYVIYLDELHKVLDIYLDSESEKKYIEDILYEYIRSIGIHRFIYSKSGEYHEKITAYNYSCDWLFKVIQRYHINENDIYVPIDKLLIETNSLFNEVRSLFPSHRQIFYDVRNYMNLYIILTLTKIDTLIKYLYNTRKKINMNIAEEYYPSFIQIFCSFNYDFDEIVKLWNREEQDNRLYPCIYTLAFFSNIKLNDFYKSSFTRYFDYDLNYLFYILYYYKADLMFNMESAEISYVSKIREYLTDNDIPQVRGIDNIFFYRNQNRKNIAIVNSINDLVKKLKAINVTYE